MFNHPRRPYYRYSNETETLQDVAEASDMNVVDVDTKRFKNLWRQLRRREKTTTKDKPAATG